MEKEICKCGHIKGKHIIKFGGDCTAKDWVDGLGWHPCNCERFEENKG